jgi:hypothetical protein
MDEQAVAVYGTEPIEVGDRRVERRLRQVTAAVAQHPERSLPQACPDWAAQQGAYRLFAHEELEPTVLSAALGRASAARCAGEKRVLVVQDTTSLDSTRHKATTELGVLERPQSRGLLLHSCLAVSEAGVPLGLLDLQVWARATVPDPTDDRRHTLPIEGKESAKWLRGLRRATERLGPGVRTLTVADREADSYELFVLAHEVDGDWLIRARHDRALAASEQRLVAAVEAAPVLAELPVPLARPEEPAARVGRCRCGGPRWIWCRHGSTSGRWRGGGRRTRRPSGSGPRSSRRCGWGWCW